jgi:hypothetical protein
MNYTDGCSRQFGNDYGGGVNLGSEKKITNSSWRPVNIY